MLFTTHGTKMRVARSRSRWLVAMTAAPLVLSSAACEGLLDVDLPGSLTEDALRDPALSEVLVTSAVGDFECGLVDMWYPGQGFEDWQNSSQARPNALAGIRSQLLGVYADPCSSTTGPIWTPIQVPRADARRAIEFLRSFTYTPTNLPDTTFLIAKARLYEGYSIQLLAETFCAVTFDAGPLISRGAAYDSAEAKFTEAIDKGLTVTGTRAAEAANVVNAARVGRARARLYQWQYSAAPAADVIADASAVTPGFQLNATYDDQPARRRNRLYNNNNVGKSMHPDPDYTNLRLAADGTHLQGGSAGVADPRVNVLIATSPTDQDGRRSFPARRQQKYRARNSPIPFSTWREARLMIAEVDPTQALTEINRMRTSTQGLSAGITTTGWPLPQISAVTWAAMTVAQQQTAVREERRRELWMQGTQAGDKIRWAYPPWKNTDEYGQARREITTMDDPLTAGIDGTGCIAIPYLERTSNAYLIPLLP